MSWTMLTTPHVRESVALMPSAVAGEMAQKIDAILVNPCHQDAEPLTEYSNGYRVRYGGFVIDYEVEERRQVIRLLFVDRDAI